VILSDLHGRTLVRHTCEICTCRTSAYFPLATLAFKCPVCFVDGYIQNKSPFAVALGDWISEDLRLTSKASPNGWLAIIIIVIIVVGEAKVDFHKFAYYSTVSYGWNRWLHPVLPLLPRSASSPARLRSPLPVWRSLPRELAAPLCRCTS